MKFLESFFEDTALRSPDAIAVDDDGATVTYAELDARANRIAHHLVSQGVGPNHRVGILTGKNIHAYESVLGILKAGASWVPMGSDLPEQRLRHLASVINPTLILVETETLKTGLAARQTGGTTIPLLVLGGACSNASDAIGAEAELEASSPEKPTVDNRSPDDLAYIIFTSGSSGAPKGVMVQHRNITQFLDLCDGFFGIGEGLRFAHHSDLTFDPSLFDLFHGWARGGAVIPMNKSSYRINPALFIEKTGVNVWFSVPSAITSIVESGGLENPALASVKHLLLTGEALPARVASAWYEAFPDTTIYNVYGTTETAIISHWYKIPKDHDPDQLVPVGNPLPGFRLRLMDGDVIVPPGEAGECVDYGSQISPGYWADEEETRAHFVRDPMDPRMPQTWYRSGDLLRLRPDGLYEYVGRADSQVKVRGQRVELGEVEVALERHETVAEAAVVALKPENSPHEARLIAFVAGRDGATSDALRDHLLKTLPRYMVPSRFIIDSLPLPQNANGKIDRRSLEKRAAGEVAGEA